MYHYHKIFENDMQMYLNIQKSIGLTRRLTERAKKQHPRLARELARRTAHIRMMQRYSHHSPESLRDGIQVLEFGHNLVTVEKNQTVTNT